MRISRIRVTTLTVPAEDTVDPSHVRPRPMVLVEVLTDEGLSGVGFTAGLPRGALHQTIRQCIEGEIAPLLLGADPLMTEALNVIMQVRLNPRSLTGVISSSISAVDIALWDLKGRFLQQPVWRLLGGARSEIPAYVTFGHLEYSLSELVDAADHFRQRGFTRLKMVVGVEAGTAPDKDAERVAAVRARIGPEVELMVDANQRYSLPAAMRFARRAEECDLAFFEEPVYANDVRLLAALRARTRIPVAAGQNEGSVQRHLEFLLHESLDIVQPNVCYVGGFTEGMKVAAVAQAFNTPVANGGGWPLHNMHLQAAVGNGSLAEFHVDMWRAGEKVFVNPPQPVGGSVVLSDAPGLGFEVNLDALEEFDDHGQ